MFSRRHSAPHRIALASVALVAGIVGGCDASGAGAARGAPPNSHDGAAAVDERNPPAAAAAVSLPGEAPIAARQEPRAEKPALSGAKGAQPRAVVEATDDLGRRIRLRAPARRVVSLVPGATETLVALGAAGQLAGRTRYDTATAVRGVPSVGAGLDPSVEAVLALRPDLVVTWNTDANRGFGERLRAAGVPVFALQTRDTADVLRLAERMGALAGRDSAARALVVRLRREMAAVAADPIRLTSAPTVLFVAWLNPPITAGRQMLVTQMIGLAGARPAFDLAQDSPQISMEEVVRREPDVLLLTAGEQGTAAARLAAAPGWRDLRAVREGRVAVVDADLVRPGPGIGRMARTIRDSLRAVLVRHPL